MLQSGSGLRSFKWSRSCFLHDKQSKQCKQWVRGLPALSWRGKSWMRITTLSTSLQAENLRQKEAIEHITARNTISMAPRSQLEIATSAVQRLIKEEASYRREAEQQKERIKKLEAQDSSADENRDYMLNQERLALEETQRIFPSLKQKIEEAIAKLDGLLVEEGKKGAESNVEHINAAKEAIANARIAEREIS